MRQLIVAACILGATIISPIILHGQDVSQSLYNAETDSTTITQLLVTNADNHSISPGKLISHYAESFYGVPFGGNVGIADDRYVVARIDSMTDRGLVDNAIALAMTTRERRPSWRDYLFNLEKVRYRRGTPAGFASRLHYLSDWALDLSSRGIIVEVTASLTEPRYAVKTIDYMSHHAEAIPELADSCNLQAIKEVEMNFKCHRFPYIKPGNIKKVTLMDGDIVAFTSALSDLDAAHIGIIKLIDGIPHLIHSEPDSGVSIESSTLTDYIHRHREYNGIRVFRLK